MKQAARVLFLLVLVAIGILIGFGYGRWYGPRQEGGSAKAAKPAGYHCPMHPHIRSAKPGDCPICGMKLVPDSEPEPAAEKGSGDAASLPAGTIRVSPEKQQLIGVRYGVAELSGGIHTIRASGKVALDETRVSKVQTRIEGWIEEVFVDFVGKQVEKGQPLLTLYSPEMLASQQEYLLAIRGSEIMQASPLAESRRQSESLIAASRKRLELWGLGEVQIAEVARTRQAFQNITVFSPISGHVMARNAFPKQRITPETELYTVADLSTVWIMADVFENEASLIRLGMPAKVTPASGGRVFVGSVQYIQPQVDMATRTLRVRIEAANPDMALKPEMFASVEFQAALPLRVTVPPEAVLNSGLRQTVFVDRGNGYLEPRLVETGERIGDRVGITKGLRAGERVVTSGNFLIDSESQLKSAAAGERKHD